MAATLRSSPLRLCSLMIQDITKAEAMIRRDVAEMQRQLAQILQQRDALDQQAEKVHQAIQEWSSLLGDDEPATESA